jgi:transposase
MIRLTAHDHGRGELSRLAVSRLRWLEWHHGANVSLTCRHFGMSRPTFYRWQARYSATNLGTLEDRRSRPRRVRSPTWTSELVEAVLQLRTQYPRWGKDKLVVMLRRQGHALSTSMVGRILRLLADRRLLPAPLQWISAPTPALASPFASPARGTGPRRKDRTAHRSTEEMEGGGGGQG